MYAAALPAPLPASGRMALPWAGLGASLAVHGLAAGVLWATWQATPWRVQPEPVVLDVRLAPMARPSASVVPVKAVHLPFPAVERVPPVRSDPQAEPAPSVPTAPRATQSPPPVPIPAPVAPAPAALPAAEAAPMRQAGAAYETRQAPNPEAPPVSRPTSTGTPHAPAVSGPVAPPRSPAEVAAEAQRRWHLVLLERLRAMKRYPMAARRLGQEGVVLIEAHIAEDGRLESARVKAGSGHVLLDNDALRLLETAAEAARGQLRPERPTRLEIPIAYRLESG